MLNDLGAGIAPDRWSAKSVDVAGCSVHSVAEGRQTIEPGLRRLIGRYLLDASRSVFWHQTLPWWTELRPARTPVRDHYSTRSSPDDCLRIRGQLPRSQAA